MWKLHYGEHIHYYMKMYKMTVLILLSCMYVYIVNEQIKLVKVWNMLKGFL